MTDSRPPGEWRRRLRREWRTWSWAAIGLLALACVVLGYFGFRAYFVDSGEGGSRIDAFYRSLQLFGLEGGAVHPVPWQLQVARLLAPVVTALALVKAIMAIFRERLQAWRLWRMSDHVIVCGLGARGLLFAKRFRDRGDNVVVIEDDPRAHGIDECRDEGIPVVIADATDEPALARARPHKARYLIAVGSDDGTNAEIAAEARELAVEHDGRVEAFIHVIGIRLCSLLRERERSAPRAGSFKLRFFNVFEAGARAWLEQYPPFGRTAPPDARPRLVVVGVGQMGKSLVIGAVRSWLALAPRSSVRPRITLIDKEATKKREWLLLEYPQLDGFCELDASDIDATTAAFDRGEFLFSDGRPDVTSIYVCFDDDARSLAAGLALAERVKDDRVEVVVRMKEYGGLATLLERPAGAEGSFANVQPFRVLEQTCTPEFLLGETRGEMLAKAIHAEYMEDQKARGATPETNPTMVPWEELPEGLKESNRRQADHDVVKLRAVGCGAAEADGRVELVNFAEHAVERMSEMEHDRWVAERSFEGWTYAPGDKNIPAMTSPHLVPWERLPDEVKDYDRNTVRALPERFAQAGLQITRRTGGAS